MHPHHVADTSLTARFDLWTTAYEPVVQAGWPGPPLALPGEAAARWPPSAAAPGPLFAAAPGPPFAAGGGVAVPYFHGEEPRLLKTTKRLLLKHNTAVKKQNRKFFLDRDVFDLVAAHPYLALTDPRLRRWYLCLSPEDRKIIQDEGGFHQFLQRHPALKLSAHHVYVKYNIGNSSAVQPTMTSSKHKCVSQAAASGAKTGSRCEMPRKHLELEMLSSNMRGNLTPLGESQQQPHEEICQTKQRLHLRDGFPAASSIAPEPSHQQAHEDRSSPLSRLSEEGPSWPTSSPLDAELERRRQRGKPELGRQTSSASVTYAEVGPSQAEWSTGENEPSPEHYGCVGPQQVSCPLGPGENELTVDDDEAGSGSEDQSDNFCGVMDDDRSILVCLASKGLPAHDAVVHSGPVTANSEALAESSESARPSEKHPPPKPRVPTCDVTVGAETADKHVITEVHMADLDYLAGELIKLRTAQEELRERKDKSARRKLRHECECVQRAQRAELSLLALQRSMCRQHCWRLCCTSAERDLLPTRHGDTSPYWPKDPPANILSVLQKLESDYDQMRDEILEGVPLEQLEPLSVDSAKITAGARYTPAQIVADVLGNPPGSPEPQARNTSGEEDGCASDQSSSGSQDAQMQAERDEREKGANRDAHQPGGASCKELSTSEAWYDAEEDLGTGGAAAAVETGRDPTESAGEEAESSVLCVSNLPRNVTESDVLLWFEKHCVSEVSVSALKTDLRVAIVTLSGPESAEAAVKELNGSSVRGRTLHVRHIGGAVGGSRSRSRSQASVSEAPQHNTKPHPPKSDPSSTERKVEPRPPLGAGVRGSRKVVCVSPTAQGTCVPQHFVTMGSFDALTAELTRRHPDAGRQRIADALMELRAEHRGALSGLPLATIREMASLLLTRPAQS